MTVGPAGDSGPDGGRPDGAAAPGGLGATAASGVLWMTAQKWVTRIGGLATMAVLTRFVAPEEFGAVAAAMSVIPFIYLLADLGFSTYVVQADEVDERTLGTSFWFACVTGLLLAAGLFAIAPVFATVFAIPQVTVVLRGLVPSILLVALQAVPVALLRRRMRFRALAAQSAVAAVVAQVVAVVLAVTGAGVWALVAQQVTAQAVAGVMAWAAARWVPRAAFSGHEFARMTRFGAKVIGVELMASVRGWAESAIVSHALGATGLGYLTIARRLIDVTTDVSAAAILPVATVVFARVRDSADRLRAAYLRALGASYATVSLPLTFVAVTASLVVPLLFGSQWQPSAPVAQALALAGILTLGAMLDHGMFYGLGRPGTWFTYATGVEVLTVATTAATVHWGLRGVALGFLGVAFVATTVRWVVVARVLGAPVSVVALPFARQVPIMLGVGLVGFVLVRAMAGTPVLVALAVTGIAMAVVHVVLVRTFATSVFGEVVRGLRIQRLVRPVPWLGSAVGPAEPRPDAGAERSEV